MSQQSTISDQLEEFRVSTQELQENPSMENMMEFIKRNFDKVYAILAFIINGNTMNNRLLLNMSHDRNSEIVGEDLIGHFLAMQQQQQQEGRDPGEASTTTSVMTATTPMRSRSSSVMSIASSSRQAVPEIEEVAESLESSQVICYDCGRIFTRGSSSNSLTKHAKETDCRPYMCGVCKKLFRDSGTRTKHARTHSGNGQVLKRKSTVMVVDVHNVDDEPPAKQFRKMDTTENTENIKPKPLKEKNPKVKSTTTSNEDGGVGSETLFAEFHNMFDEHRSSDDETND